MMYCKNLNKLIAEIDETDCPNDCRRCKECVELIGEVEEVFGGRKMKRYKLLSFCDGEVEIVVLEADS